MCARNAVAGKNAIHAEYTFVYVRGHHNCNVHSWPCYQSTDVRMCLINCVFPDTKSMLPSYRSLSGFATKRHKLENWKSQERRNGPAVMHMCFHCTVGSGPCTSYVPGNPSPKPLFLVNMKRLSRGFVTLSTKPCRRSSLKGAPSHL